MNGKRVISLITSMKQLFHTSFISLQKGFALVRFLKKKIIVDHVMPFKTMNGFYFLT